MDENNFNIGLRIGLALKNIREANSITQTKLAEVTGLPRSQISMMENGTRNQRINVEALRKAALFLGFSGLGELITWAEEKITPESILEKLEN